jgi:hypothetical protein
VRNVGSPKSAVKGARVTPAVVSAFSSASPSTPAKPLHSTMPDAPDVPVASQAAVGLAPLPLAAPMSKSTPVRIQVPSIGVDSTLTALGLQADGSLQVPPAAFPAGWYTGAPTPGQLGPAIIAGHIDWAGKDGVFFRLHSLLPGAYVDVTRADGSVAVFWVSGVQEFPKEAFPTSLVYGNTSYSALRVITCGGTFNSKAHSYVDDIVVFAELVGPTAT